MSEIAGNGPAHPAEDETTREMRRQSRRAFLTMGAGAAAGLVGWHWLTTRTTVGDLSSPLRRTLELNERLSRRYFDSSRLAPTFPRDRAEEPRVNGVEGMSAPFDPARWQLQVVSGNVTRTVALADIMRLPQVEMTTELKCIEGWSTIVTWAGTRLSEFAAAFGVATRDGRPLDPARRSAALFDYVALATPDEGYYVGLDVESALHPQTLLCYAMNGAPLSLPHGAPLRLITTVKYGIKSIKRIGAIAFTDDRPADFWAERGYDWYAGH